MEQNQMIGKIARNPRACSGGDVASIITRRTDRRGGAHVMTDGLVHRQWLIALLAAVAFAAQAYAQSFPSKTMKIIVPYAPGGSIDLTARVIAKNLQDNIGQSVIV